MTEKNFNLQEVFKNSESWHSPLNVWRYGIYSHHPRFWWNNFKQFFHNIKYAWQRATKGYCDWDTWNLDCHYKHLFFSSIMHLAEHTHGYPGVEPFETPEKWDKFLKDMAEHFYKSTEEYDDTYRENPYDIHSNWEKYSKYMTEAEAYKEYHKLAGLYMLKDSFNHLWD